MASQIMDSIEAQKFTSRYVCSTCWGELDAFRVEGERYLSEVKCANPDCTGAGFVTRRYVERRKTDDHFDYLEAKRNLGKALNLPDTNSGKTPDQLINELGF